MCAKSEKKLLEIRWNVAGRKFAKFLPMDNYTAARDNSLQSALLEICSKSYKLLELR
jgi:hypothetical protein